MTELHAYAGVQLCKGQPCKQMQRDYSLATGPRISSGCTILHTFAYYGGIHLRGCGSTGIVPHFSLSTHGEPWRTARPSRKKYPERLHLVFTGFVAGCPKEANLQEVLIPHQPQDFLGRLRASDREWLDLPTRWHRSRQTARHEQPGGQSKCHARGHELLLPNPRLLALPSSPTSGRVLRTS